MPGDDLITTCAYDSSDRMTTTNLGEPSNDEMCFNFITYFPLLVREAGLPCMCKRMLATARLLLQENIDICIAGNSLNYATCTTRRVLSKVRPPAKS